MTGWASWGLNGFPLGRWALQLSWDKIAGKTIRNAHVPSNNSTRADLKWLSSALKTWNGQQLLKSYFWRLSEADLTFFYDTCPTGLGLWIPQRNKGWIFRLDPPSRDIYWAELAATVLCLMISKDIGAKQIVIFTDSHNVVDLFGSHRAIATVRLMFRTAIDLMLSEDYDVKVKHVPGDQNTVADDLSRNNLDIARKRHRS